MVRLFGGSPANAGILPEVRWSCNRSSRQLKFAHETEIDRGHVSAGCLPRGTDFGLFAERGAETGSNGATVNASEYSGTAVSARGYKCTAVNACGYSSANGCFCDESISGGCGIAAADWGDSNNDREAYYSTRSCCDGID